VLCIQIIPPGTCTRILYRYCNTRRGIGKKGHPRGNLPRGYSTILVPLTPVLRAPPSRLKTEPQKSPEHRSVPSASELGGKGKWNEWGSLYPVVPVGLELARRDMIDYGTDWVRFLVGKHAVTVGLSMIAISKKLR